MFGDSKKASKLISWRGCSPSTFIRYCPQQKGARFHAWFSFQSCFCKIWKWHLALRRISRTVWKFRPVSIEEFLRTCRYWFVWRCQDHWSRASLGGGNPECQTSTSAWWFQTSVIFPTIWDGWLTNTSYHRHQPVLRSKYIPQNNSMFDHWKQPSWENGDSCPDAVLSSGCQQRNVFSLSTPGFGFLETGDMPALMHVNASILPDASDAEWEWLERWLGENQCE